LRNTRISIQHVAVQADAGSPVGPGNPQPAAPATALGVCAGAHAAALAGLLGPHPDEARCL